MSRWLCYDGDGLEGDEVDAPRAQVAAERYATRRAHETWEIPYGQNMTVAWVRASVRVHRSTGACVYAKDYSTHNVTLHVAITRRPCDGASEEDPTA